MDLRGDAHRYGILASILHWISAAIVIALLPLGVLAARSDEPSQTASLLRLHVPLGFLVLALTVVRLLWWWGDRRPDAAFGPRWQAVTARATHLLLYGVLVLLGMSGIALTVVSGAGPVLFGSGPGPLPRFEQFGPMTAHAAGALVLAALLALHLGAALYHQVYRRDGLFSRVAVHQGGK